MYDLKFRRKELGLTLQEVGNVVGVGASTVRKWEQGMIKNMNRDKISLLAKVLKINPLLLINENGEHEPLEPTPKGYKIPVLGEVAAGIPIEAIEDILDYEELPTAWRKKGEFFGLQIKGNSMQPRMADGDVVIVRQQSDANTGDTVIAIVNGDNATCKKLKKTENGLMLISTNPEYEPMFYTWAEVKEKPVTIIGKVVELRAKF